MPKSINGATFKKMLLSGYQTLEENKSAIDALNVFPVPDEIGRASCRERV